MNNLVKLTECTLTDQELIQKVDQGTDQMYRARRIPDMCIPARPNEDYDLLVGELILRFAKMKKHDDWIDFNDHEPDINQICIVAAGSESEAQIIPLTWDGKEFVWHEHAEPLNLDPFPTEEVTHWRPWPNDPDENTVGVAKSNQAISEMDLGCLVPGIKRYKD